MSTLTDAASCMKESPSGPAVARKYPAVASSPSSNGSRGIEYQVDGVAGEFGHRLPGIRCTATGDLDLE